jgi:hypothetical protein
MELTESCIERGLRRFGGWNLLQTLAPIRNSCSKLSKSPDTAQTDLGQLGTKSERAGLALSGGAKYLLVEIGGKTL